MDINNFSGRLMRWRLKVSEVFYKVQYQKGLKNTPADTLSCLTISSETTQEVNEELSDYPKSPKVRVASTPKAFIHTQAKPLEHVHDEVMKYDLQEINDSVVHGHDDLLDDADAILDDLLTSDDVLRSTTSMAGETANHYLLLTMSDELPQEQAQDNFVREVASRLNQGRLPPSPFVKIVSFFRLHLAECIL